MKFQIISIIFTCILLAACGGDDSPSPGSQCAQCSVDSDCNQGLTCELFSNQFGLFKKCAAPGTETCGF